MSDAAPFVEIAKLYARTSRRGTHYWGGRLNDSDVDVYLFKNEDGRKKKDCREEYRLMVRERDLDKLALPEKEMP